MVSRKLKKYSLRGSKAVGVFLAALLAVQGVAPVHAQGLKKLPQALMPAPGNTGIQLNLLGVRAGVPVVTNLDHPLFLSSWMGHPEEIVASTRYGDVTSRDLYLWMILRESPNKAFIWELYQKSKLPKDREKLAKALRVEIDEYVFTNLIIPRLMPTVPQDAVYDIKHHVYTLPAFQTVFLNSVILPQVHVRDADRLKFLNEHTAEIVEPQRLRARYIFMKSPETSPAEEQDRVEVDMDELRSSILRGDTDFAAAAREHSQAPSASRGGEIPPFQHGELFFLFENAAAELEPGGVSPVFRGPGGFYMVQLIEVLEPEEPSLENPAHAKLVYEGLSRQVMRANYEIYMRDMLLERRRITEKVWAWDQLEDCEAVGDVCDFVISKGQFRSAWPGVEDNNLRLRTDIIAPQLRTILEREAMAQEVRDLGFANDPMLERARWMAGNIIRRDAWIDSMRQSLPISEQLVQNFWEENPGLFTPLALKRVIRLTLTPSNTAPLPAQTRLEMEQVLAGAAGIAAPPVQVAKRKIQDEERESLVYDPLERTEEAFQMMAEPDSEMNFYSEEFSTSSLQSLIESEPLEVPSLEGEPAPGMDVLPGPAPVTTDTLGTLMDKIEDTETLDLSTTEPQGGAAPTPPAGGLLPGDDILPATATTDREVPADPTETVLPPAAAGTPAPYIGRRPGKTEVITGPPIIREEVVPVTKPATRPTGGSVPVGITATAIAPVAPLEPTPNIRKQLPPPETSSIPYNPHWFYALIDRSQIRSVIGEYASSDWLLTMEDLGFIYLEDFADIPRKVEEVPVGGITRPILRGRSAVAWYIEEARTVTKEPFEQIKTHAYEIYRNTQIDSTVSSTYNSELEKASVDYKF